MGSKSKKLKVLHTSSGSGSTVVVKEKKKKQTIKQVVKKEIENSHKPKTISPSGSMKPKIVGTFIKPVRRQKLSFEGSWNGLCSSPNVSVPYVFNMNSIADPDYSNFTKNTRANGWTICNTLYNAYRVHTCKVTIKFFNHSEWPTYVILSANNNVGIQPASTLPADILARPGSFGKICGRYGSDNDTVTISKTYKLYEVEGIPQDEYGDSDKTSAAMITTPLDNCFCYATLATMPEGFLNSSFGVFNIKMEFDVELLNPKEPVATQP